MHVNPHLISRFLHISLEQIADAERFADLRGTLVRPFQRSNRRMRSHVDSLNFRELGGDFIGHSLAEIGAVWLRAHVLQRKDGNGWLGGTGPRWCRRMFLVPCNPCNRQQDQQSEAGEDDSALEW